MLAKASSDAFLPVFIDDNAVEDAVLPSQLAVTPATPGHRRLWLAVLDEAWRDVHRTSDRVRSAARAYLASADDSPGAFRWVCRELDFDADALAAAMLRNPCSRPRYAGILGMATMRVGGYRVSM